MRLCQDNINGERTSLNSKIDSGFTSSCNGNLEHYGGWKVAHTCQVYGTISRSCLRRSHQPPVGTLTPRLPAAGDPINGTITIELYVSICESYHPGFLPYQHYYVSHAWGYQARISPRSATLVGPDGLGRSLEQCNVTGAKISSLIHLPAEALVSMCTLVRCVSDYLVTHALV